MNTQAMDLDFTEPQFPQKIDFLQIKSTLLSTWFVGLATASIISCCLLVTASIASQSRVEPPAIDPVQVQISTTKQSLVQTSFEISEQRRRDDFSPDRPTQYGDLQALLQQNAIEIRAEVDAQFSDPKHPNYQKNKTLIFQSLRNDAMMQMEVALSGKASLNYENPKTGKVVSVKLRSAELITHAMMRLEAINIAMNTDISQPIDTTVVAENIAKQEYQAKAAKADEQEALGQTEIANQLRQTSVFGDEIDPRMSPNNLP